MSDQARLAELHSPHVGIAGREGPERVVGMVDDFRHGLDEAIEFRTCEPPHLLLRPAAQFGPDELPDGGGTLAPRALCVRTWSCC